MRVISNLLKGTVVISLAAILFGCSAGEVVETDKMSGNFDNISKSIQIVMVPNQDIANDEHHRQQLSTMIASQIAKTQIFEHVISDKTGTAPLKMKVKIVGVDEPSGAVTVFASSAAKAEVKLDVTFENKTKIASVHVLGNSNHKMRATVGGFGVEGSGSYTKSALEQAAAHLAKYIKEHSSKAKS